MAEWRWYSATAATPKMLAPCNAWFDLSCVRSIESYTDSVVPSSRAKNWCRAARTHLSNHTHTHTHHSPPQCNLCCVQHHRSHEMRDVRWSAPDGAWSNNYRTYPGGYHNLVLAFDIFHRSVRLQVMGPASLRWIPSIPRTPLDAANCVIWAKSALESSVIFCSIE